MKHIVVILSFLAISCTTFAAGSPFGRTEYENLVNYYASKYTQAYIERNTTRRPEYNKYLDNIKNKIDGSSIDNPLPFSELVELLNTNDYNNTADTIKARYYETVSGSYNKSMTIDDVIKTLSFRDAEKYKIDDDVTKGLAKEVKDKFSNGNESNEGTQQLQKQVTALKERGQTLFITIFVLGLILILLGYFVVKYFMNLRFSHRHKKNVEDYPSHSELMSGFCTKSDLEQAKSEIKKLEQRLRDIEIKLASSPQPTPPQQSPQPAPPQQPPENIQRKYLRTPVEGGRFKKVFDTQTADCFYEMYDFKEKEAKFRFVGDPKSAIAQKSAVFDNITEIVDGDYRSAKSVDTVVPGEIVQDSDGSWLVTKPAKIKFS